MRKRRFGSGPARASKAAGLLLSCVLLTSCWDEVIIQDLLYVTAMGVEYDAKTGQYEVYGHLIDVTKVAKKEEGGGSGKNVSFVGHASGPSPYSALYNLYRTMQMEPNLDHLMTLVVGESSLPKLKDILDGINRSRAVRYTVNLMGTSDAMAKLFQSSEIVSKSPLNTNIYQPDSNPTNKPFDSPWDLQRMTRSFSHCACTAFIPRLDSVAAWESSSKKPSLPRFNGAYVLAEQRYKGMFTDDELAGARWFRGTAKSILVPLSQDGEFVGALNVKKAKRSVKFVDSAGAPSFRLKLKADMTLIELLKSFPDRELEKLAESSIRQEIERTRKLSVSKDVDLFGLEETVFRYHPKRWKRLKTEGTEFAKLPVRVEVEVHLLHPGKRKLNQS
ncbi:hypothetical protein J19TS2_10040 [Cohnella xylanilytica]|uniref:Ger(X)C family germination protein n=1 Tax=Cohnella xylanilytica TaxID=557555 RepID=A0A841U6J3_9BACL|nr:Ger(x)C family spore germination C-terminal domain-containing protein [Cohnella xylanilytica]MBB6693610.1 hypothetical protein [Cohnella xylanilytica]GIO11449.1 hypothetical protein J19TS2_10040 [Cohnella xylanilytica]